MEIRDPLINDSEKQKLIQEKSVNISSMYHCQTGI
jgi:hypothetical protein